MDRAPPNKHRVTASGVFPGNRTRLLPANSPLRMRHTVDKNLSNKIPDLVQRRRLQAKDMSQHFVGPVKYQQFADTYLKPSPEYKPVTAVNKRVLGLLKSIPLSPKVEKEMYGPLVKCANEICTNLNFFEATDINIDDEKQKVDIGAERKKGSKSKKDDTNGRRLVNMEVKRSNTDDGFNFAFDKTDTVGSLLEKAGDDAQKSIGQITAYASSQFARQHRHFLFSICIYNTYARIIRWDRAGAIVTAPIDYRKHPARFVDLFQRFDQMNDKQLGLDTSVTLATTAEENKLLNAVKKHQEAVERNQSLPIPDVDLTLDESFASYKISVPVQNQVAHHYIVKRPFQSSSSLLWGRSTRAYVAYGVTEQHLVFLKDYWRPVEKDRDSEEKIYGEFDEYFERKPDIRQHLPVVISSGDVRHKGTSDCRKGEFQDTVTQSKRGDPGMRQTVDMKTLRHHRIVQELEFPLLNVPSSKDAVQIIRDAAKVIIAVFDTKSKRLHRDVSVLNIMTVEIEGILRGILNDWDHSKKMLPSTDSNIYRTGTWLFMSIRLGDEVEKVHSILDDFESCFWVLLYVALHRFRHNGSRDNLVMFEEVTGNRGGGLKFRFVTRPPIGHRARKDNPVIFDCAPLHQLLEDLRLYFKEYHEAFISTKEDDAFAILEKHLVEHPEEFLAIFDKALAADGWTENDAVPSGDNFPPLRINDQGKLEAEAAAEERVKTFNTRNAEQDVEHAKQRNQSGPSSPALVENGEDVEQPRDLQSSSLPKRSTRSSAARLAKSVLPPHPPPPPSKPPLPRYNTRSASKRALPDNNHQDETGPASKRRNTNAHSRTAKKPEELPEAPPQKRNLRRIKSQGDAPGKNSDGGVIGRKRKNN